MSGPLSPLRGQALSWVLLCPRPLPSSEQSVGRAETLWGRVVLPIRRGLLGWPVALPGRSRLCCRSRAGEHMLPASSLENPWGRTAGPRAGSPPPPRPCTPGMQRLSSSCSSSPLPCLLPLCLLLLPGPPLLLCLRPPPPPPPSSFLLLPTPPSQGGSGTLGSIHLTRYEYDPPLSSV